LDGGDLRLDLRLQDAATGETMPLSRKRQRRANGMKLVGRVGATLRAKLGVEADISPAEAAAVSASIPVSPEVARLTRRFGEVAGVRCVAARPLLEKTVAAEPD